MPVCSTESSIIRLPNRLVHKAFHHGRNTILHMMIAHDDRLAAREQAGQAHRPVHAAREFSRLVHPYTNTASLSQSSCVLIRASRATHTQPKARKSPAPWRQLNLEYALVKSAICQSHCILDCRSASVLTSFLQERFARKNEAVELRRAFDALDFKRDGKLDAQELGQLFNKLGHSLRKVRPFKLYALLCAEPPPSFPG